MSNDPINETAALRIVSAMVCQASWDLKGTNSLQRETAFHFFKSKLFRQICGVLGLNARVCVRRVLQDYEDTGNNKSKDRQRKSPETRHKLGKIQGKLRPHIWGKTKKRNGKQCSTRAFTAQVNYTFQNVLQPEKAATAGCFWL